MMQLSIAFTTCLLLVTYTGVASQSDSGAGDVYYLPVTQDVWLERGTTNYNSVRYLLVGTHLGYPLKRSLLQFRDLPSSCSRIKWAKMYLYFVYSHKPSFYTVNQAPYISRPLQVHQVKREWRESQATSTYRMRGRSWSRPYLALDGSDADPNGLLCEPVTINTYRPSGYIEFDITEAMRNWKDGQPNYGVLLLATNEAALGRDTRFYSNAYSSCNPYVNVLCE